ncbi:MAG TPA: ADYC domain-containing protein, partial [Kofleriaceae bacterium]
ARPIHPVVKNFAVALSLLLSLTSACAFEYGGEDEDIGDLDLEGRVINGRVINGRLINGRLINGTAFSGALASVSLDHVMVGGAYQNQVALAQGKFTKNTTTGAGFNNAVFDATLSDGKVVPVKITSVRQAAADLWAYRISYQSDTGWSPYCLDTAGAEVEAYPLNGVWNLAEGVSGGGARSTPAGKFTFACRAAALGKCVDFGYVPWRSVSGTSLLGYHDACVRAVRADWCGDGRSWTVNGNLINIFDRKQVQSDTESWLGEAEWSTAGATCLNKDRIEEGIFRGEVFPACATGRKKDLCGNGFTTNASLLATESNL